MSIDQEWLETDGRGGYAMSTAAFVPTRRYHGLLVHARRPPVDRVVLVNSIELALECDGQRFDRIEMVSFSHDPVPTWVLRFDEGSIVEQKFLLCRTRLVAVLCWRRIGGTPGGVLRARPLLTGRDFHSLHYQNHNFNFEPKYVHSTVTWSPYTGIPAITAITTGSYEHQPEWRNGVYYHQEHLRGFDCHEDYASPGTFVMDLHESPTLGFAVADKSWRDPSALERIQEAVNHSDSRRKRLGTAFDRAADAYFVCRGKNGRSIVAGYPWFNDWGRDTMIALRGLAIVRRRRKYAREVLQTWADTIDQGMLPNCFADDGKPSYHAMDAPLWFIVAAYEFLRSASGEFPSKIPGKKKLVAAISAILDHYAAGTRHGIRADDDCLLTGGSPDTNLTWMDACVNGKPVTPRYGKPVEINALWINALWIGSQLDDEWARYFNTAVASFQDRFWLDEGYLADALDDDARTVDKSFRPNQIFAVGGLPLVLLPRDKAATVVDAVERALYTPLGLRTLAPDDPRYHGRYEGDAAQRDSIYHQGTAWPWLLGPFVEAWLRVRDFSDDAREAAGERFVMPWLADVGNTSLGHVAEIADGDPPHTPRGCPFQAWSLSELLRVRALLDGSPSDHERGIWIGGNVP